jgi:hypothetical protein
LSRRLIRLCFVEFILAAALVPSASAASFLYGVSGGSPGTYSSGLAQLPARNVSLYRTDANWEGVQSLPPPAPYNWSPDDATVTTLAGAGMTWFPILDYAASWATPGGIWNGAPDPSAYAAFAAAFVARYGPHGQFWLSHPNVTYRPVRQVEAWNEENTAEFWTPQDSNAPGRYFDLYSRAKAAVHAVSPAVTVVFGGLLDSATSPLPWLAEMNRERPGSLRSIQALGWHPYLYFLSSISSHLQRLRSFLNAKGASSVPIEITELGSNGGFVSQRSWESILSTLAARLPSSGCGVNTLIPFVWGDGSGDTEDAQGWFTLSTRTGQLTAPGSAFTASAASATSRASVASASGGPLCTPARDLHHTIIG